VILHYDDWGNLNKINRTAADGALIARRALSWDVENRLTGATITGREGDKPETTIEADYRYDYTGRRTAKSAPRLGIPGSGDDTLLYVSDFFARRWNGNTASVHISAGQARIGSVRLNRTQQGTDRYSYLYHSELPNGSVTAVTRPTGVNEFEGELIERLEYKPYGEPIHRLRDIGPIANSNSRKSENLADIAGEGPEIDRSADRRFPFYAYSGKEYDLETGYFYFGRRYYDPNTVTWLNADPALNEYLNFSWHGGVARPSNLATFAFAFDNPIANTDFDGRKVTLLTVYDPLLTVGGQKFLEYGSHSALYVENKSATFLFDPGGSYATDIAKQSGNDVVEGDLARIDLFVKFHESHGNRVASDAINLSEKDEITLAQRLHVLDAQGKPTEEQRPAFMPMTCAVSVCQELKGVGPFEKLNARTPGGLRDEFQRAIKGYELLPPLPAGKPLRKLP
jgi:RHS repeat-associated protein